MTRRNPCKRYARLTLEQAREIKAAFREGKRVAEIAARYPVVQQTLWAIKYGRTWREA